MYIIIIIIIILLCISEGRKTGRKEKMERRVAHLTIFLFLRSSHYGVSTVTGDIMPLPPLFEWHLFSSTTATMDPGDLGLKSTLLVLS